MLKTKLSCISLFFIGFLYAQFTLTPDSNFGTDYAHGYTGISTIYLNQQLTNSGPMSAPKCIVAIDEGYIAVASKVLEDNGNTSVSTLNIKNLQTGVNTQSLSLKNSDVIASGVAGYCLVFDMVYNASEDKIYLVGKAMTENKAFLFRLKRKVIKNSHQFEFDSSFDGDGKYWFSDGIITGVCTSGTDVFVSGDFSNTVNIMRFSNSGSLLTTFQVTGLHISGNSTKIDKYPSMQNRFFISGSQEGHPALWGLDLNTTNNSFSLSVSNSLNGAIEGSGQFKDFCYVFNVESNLLDILCVGSTVNELNESVSGGDGIYVKYLGTTSSNLNLNYVNSFKNGSGLIGTGNYSNISNAACSFKKIVAHGNYFFLIGTSFTNNIWDKRLNICVLSSNGQTLNRIYEANQGVYSHFPDEFIIDQMTNRLVYVSCAFQALAGKLIIQ